MQRLIMTSDNPIFSYSLRNLLSKIIDCQRFYLKLQSLFTFMAYLFNDHPNLWSVLQCEESPFLVYVNLRDPLPQFFCHSQSLMVFTTQDSISQSHKTIYFIYICTSLCTLHIRHWQKGKTWPRGSVMIWRKAIHLRRWHFSKAVAGTENDVVTLHDFWKSCFTLYKEH